MSGGGDARCAMDCEPGVPPVDRGGLAGVDSHPDLDRYSFGPLEVPQRTLSFQRGGDRFVCRCECEEERVALRVDLVAAMTGECLTEQTLVVGQDARVAAAELADEPRRTLDVGEEERDGPAGKVRHGRQDGAQPRAVPARQTPALTER